MVRARVLSCIVLFGMFGWITWAGDLGGPRANLSLTQDEQALKQAGVQLESASLLDYFRRRTPDEEMQVRLRQSASQLGSSSYAVRLRATEELIQAGRTALPWLKQTLHSKDTETVRRAQYCIRVIEQNTRLSLSAPASRVLAERRVPGAIEVLLAYLPFVDEPWVEEEIRNSLMKLAMTGGKAAPAVESSLTAPETKRRATAAWIVGQADDVEQRRRVIPRLSDDAIEVRFLAASALLHAREPIAVPALIRLLADGNPEVAWRSEDLLFRVAGEAGPAVWLDAANDNYAPKVREAWESWWKANSAKLDWKSIRLGDQALGLTLIVENQRPEGTGRIYECNSAGQIRWQVHMQNPVDAQWLPGGRLLVGDSRASQVFEMDTRGIVGWKHAGIAPTSCHRLANGNTVLSTYQSIIEISREGKIIFTYNTQGHTYHARKLADGHYVWIDANGEVSEIDGKGKLVARTTIGAGLTWGSIERLRNGRYLVCLGGVNKVQEIDLAGKVYWEKSVNNPNRAVRLTNGHILVASHGDQCIYEFDAQGNERWKHACAGRPFAVERR